MKIAFTGTHSTGKTTLLDVLRKDDKFKDFIFVEEITRQLEKQGYVINELSGDETQQLMIDAHCDAIKHENSVLDRCVLDVICYTTYFYRRGQISEEVFQDSMIKFMINIKKYDYLLHLKPEFDIVEDGIRSTNIEFQMEVDKIFDMYIHLFNIKVHTITGSVEERLKQINEIIKG